MAEDEEKDNPMEPEFPSGRIKKIMKVDPEVERISSEALFLMSCSTELFLRFLAQNSAQVATQKKRKTVKLEHLRMAVKSHQPTSDFLLDSLHLPSQPPPTTHRTSRSAADSDKPPPPGTCRIDRFFRKPEEEAPAEEAP